MEKKYKGNANKGGVYRIINQVNNKVYIGSCKTFKTRAAGHASSLRRNKHHNKHLQASWDKHGADAFLFEVVEVVNGDKKTRTAREQFFISQWEENWERCYNFNKKADSSDRICWSKDKDGFSEEHKQKISKSLKAFYKANPEAAKKAGERIAKARPADAAAKVYETHLVAPDGKEYRRIQNLAKFCKKHGLSRQHLSQVLSGNRVHHKGWVLKENEEFSGTTKIPMVGETKKKIAKANTGQKRSPATREKLRLQKLGNRNPNFGKSMLEKTRQALLKANTGRKMSNATKHALAKSRQKTYDITLVDPSGKRFGPIVNMTQFCKTHNLERSLLMKVVAGQRNHHKGWRLAA